MRERIRHSISIFLVLCTGVAALNACASAGGRPGSCPVAPADSAFLRGGAAYNACDVDTPAKLTNANVQPDFRPATPRSGCYSAEVEFVVGVNGRPETETARILRSNDPDYATAVLQTVPRWRYEPARRGGVAVREIVRERPVQNFAVIAVPKGGSPEAVMAHRPPPTGC